MTNIVSEAANQHHPEADCTKLQVIRSKKKNRSDINTYCNLIHLNDKHMFILNINIKTIGIIILIKYFP